MITIVGAGRVGASAAAFIMTREVDREVLLIDIVEGLPQGEALDLNHAASIAGKSVFFRGSNNYEDMRGSDLVLVTAGFPRRPGLTREELAAKNAEIVAGIADQVRRYAPDAVTILTTNPLDAMVYVFYKRLKFPRERVLGFSGILDSGRMAFYTSQVMGVAPHAITPVVLGQHGENMYPVPELSMVYGKPLSELLTPQQYQEVVQKTINAGAEITNLRKFSSNWGPGMGLAIMAEAVMKDRKMVVEASVYLNGEYGVHDIFAEVPIVLGRRGVERILELNLNPRQRDLFLRSVEAIRKNLQQVPAQYLE
jgi:malate dehydrogenase